MTREQYLEEISRLQEELAQWQRHYIELEDAHQRLLERCQRMERRLHQIEKERIMLGGECQWCGQTMLAATRGRKKQYCSDACKQANYRYNQLWRHVTEQSVTCSEGK